MRDRSAVNIVGVVLCTAWLTPVFAQAPAGGRGASARAPETLIVPHESWTCGMPAPEGGTAVFDITMPIDRIADLGRTQYGRRTVAVALDFALTLANGVVEIEQRFVLRTVDGKYILVRSAGTGPDASDVRIVLDVEAPDASDAAWLNTGTFVARRTLDATRRTLTLRVYEVPPAASAAGARVVRITKPEGVAAQPWDYRKAAPDGKRGAQVITEQVTLASSQSVGASKYGNRNVIPITGGEVSGRITGTVVPGGADYQNLTPPATIDAHYLWQAADGEFIIVRNGGGFASLAPTFEARVDGPYARFNSGLYLSSNPQPSPGGVALTFYESTR
jgi:hypothetical protein